VSLLAARRIEQQERNDTEEGQRNDGSEPSELEENGAGRLRTFHAALRRCLRHGGILSQTLVDH
jgi:hypothetical protein